MLNDFLSLCGFDKKEMDGERKNIEKAFSILGITSQDIERSIPFVQKMFDVELLGIRKSLGVALKELVNLALARERYKKIIYVTQPIFSPPWEAAMEAGGGDVLAVTPEFTLCMTMGGMFDKYEPILEAAEEKGLRAGGAHCGSHQFRLGGIAKGIIPVPDLIVSLGSYYCDQSGELDNLFNNVYRIPVAYVDGSMDSIDDDYPAVSPRRVQYAAQSMRRAEGEIEALIGKQITDQMKRNALIAIGRTWKPFQDIVDFLKYDPVPISAADITQLFYLQAVPMVHREELIGAFEILKGELKERVEKGIGVLPKGAPRIFFGMFPLVNQSVAKMVEEIGMASVGMPIITMCEAERTKGAFKTFEERLIEAMHKKGLYHSGLGMARYLKDICAEQKVEGAIIFVPYNCRPMSYPAVMAKELIVNELGIPAMLLEGDWYDNRDYSAQALRTRVETFAGMLKSAR